MYVLDGKRLYMAALSRRMKELGYKAHVSHIARVFSGEREPGDKFVEGMALALEVSTDRVRDIIRQIRKAQAEYDKLPTYF